MPICDICGAPATCACRDIRETWPVKGRDGMWWSTWIGDGPARIRCDKHCDDGSQVSHQRELTRGCVEQYIRLKDNGEDISDLVMAYDEPQVTYHPSWWTPNRYYRRTTKEKK